MQSVLDVVDLALGLYTWIIIASAIISWLVAFNVINTRNDFVRAVWDFLYRVTEPALRPIRKVLPNLGGNRHLADHPAASDLLPAERHRPLPAPPAALRATGASGARA